MSAIDPTKPVAGSPTTASVRANFAAAKAEIEALDSGKASLSGATFTGTVNLSATWQIGGVAVSASAAELNHLVGVTSGIQAQLDSKLEAGDVTSSVWGNITGTLSSQTDLQNAINAKANIASPTFTGTATTPTLQIGSWTIIQSGTKLMFQYGGTNRFSIDSSGNIIADNNVTAYGTP